MSSNDRQTKLEYGDFQTPLELAQMVCRKLIELDVNPKVIIEPTCGIGNFIQAAANSFPSASKIIGIEINKSYLIELIAKQELLQDERCEVKHGEFFDFDWKSLINQFNHRVLILGNFTWVTNSQQGTIGSKKKPKKRNFLKQIGLDALTGKSNFDIS
jgi:hypothetical protein